MRVVLAPDSFKGSLAAADVAAALEEGIHAVAPAAEVLRRPMADGGEGTLAAFEAAISGAERMPVRVTGPTGEATEASWLRLPAEAGQDGTTGVVELANTSGIELLEELRPWDADTTGFGQAIAAALDAGVSRLILGIGSSSSTDGGLGLLRALGAEFFDAAGVPVPPGARGLLAVARADVSGLRPVPEALVLTDVTNPLTGPRGAAAIFGPQKGLTGDEQIAEVDGALARFAVLLGIDADAAGAGAAGGTGAALQFWGAKPAQGAEWLAQLIGLRAALHGADLVITGEGSFDGQSAAGKVPSLVAELAAAEGVPVALVAGRITAEATMFAATASLTDIAGSAEASLAEPARYARVAGEVIARHTLTR